MKQLFLAYIGYSIGSTGVPMYQFWEPTDFVPVVAQVNRQTGEVEGRMFTDVLFLALGILNETGEGRHLLQTAAADVFENGLGFEMEFDLAVTYDQVKRARFLEYMKWGTTGGYDSNNRYFGPYMTDSPLGWYTGGWFFGKNGRKQAIVSLYQSGDPLYEQISQFIRGNYQPHKMI